MWKDIMIMNISKKLTILAGLFDSSRLLIGAIHSLFLLSRGVELKYLAILQIVYCITVLIVDFPAGIFADIVNRKLNVLIACFSASLFYPLCLFAPNLNILILSEII